MLFNATHQGRTTTVTVFAEDGSALAGMTGAGIARCRPEDVLIPEVGEAIALGRAIQDLGSKVEAGALSCSFSQDDLAKAFEMLELLGVQVLIGFE